MKKISSRLGMSLMSVIVAIGLAGGLAYMISQLMLSSAKVSRSARITGSLIDLRSQFVLINKDPSFWLTKLRQSPTTKNIFAPCLVNTPNPKYKCPSVDEKLFELDPELKKIAGAFHPASTPLVDINGEKVAGTIKEPHYTDAAGKACDKNPDQCPLQSIGFFFRESDSDTKSPGTASFVIKIEKNPSFTLVSETPIKPTYISLFVGTSWMSDTSTSNTASTTNSANQDQKNCLPKGATTNIPDACCSKKARCLPSFKSATFILKWSTDNSGSWGIVPITDFFDKSELPYFNALHNTSDPNFISTIDISGSDMFACLEVHSSNVDAQSFPSKYPLMCR